MSLRHARKSVHQRTDRDGGSRHTRNGEEVERCEVEKTDISVISSTDGAFKVGTRIIYNRVHWNSTTKVTSPSGVRNIGTR